MDYLKDFFGKMVNSEGRISRKDFWMTILWVFAFNLVFNLVFGIIASIIGNIVKLPSLAAIVVSIVSFIVLLSTVSMQIRRLHDSNRSALNIFWNLVPIVGQFVVFYFYCVPGDAVANKYGEPTSVLNTTF